MEDNVKFEKKKIDGIVWYRRVGDDFWVADGEGL